MEVRLGSNAVEGSGTENGHWFSGRRADVSCVGKGWKGDVGHPDQHLPEGQKRVATGAVPLALLAGCDEAAPVREAVLHPGQSITAANKFGTVRVLRQRASLTRQVRVRTIAGLEPL
jgi:hypothetical protein